MRKLLTILFLLLVCASMLLMSCKKKEPLGSEENPLIWAFVPSGDTGEISAGAREISKMIFDKTGLYVEENVASDYAGVIEALSSKPPSAHMAALATFSYIQAADRGVAEAALVSVRFGAPYYNGQIIAHVDSGIKKISDLKGKTFARPDPLSTSGWIIPMITMRANGVDPDNDLEQVVDAGGHTAVVSAVYNGDAHAGATYVDARGNIEDDFPDVTDKVVVIAISENIPNDGMQFHPDVPDEIREPIIKAMLEILATEEGQAAMEGAYQWTGLERHDDSFYDPFRQVLQAAGVKAEDFED